MSEDHEPVSQADPMTDDTLILSDEPGRRISRIGETVRRPTGWWTPAVHALLQHLEDGGFPYSPRVIGSDEEGREILTYIAGTSGAQSWAAVVGDVGLTRFAGLLRAYHDAVSTFRPASGTIWACGDGAPRKGEIICHGDFGPWNVVWRDDHPIGILDWDLAGRGPSLEDVAYALEYTAPFRDDATATRWLGYSSPPDRKRRLEVFAEAYGLAGSRGLVDQVVHRQRLTLARVRRLAERGLEPQATWVANGYLDQLRARADWTERHRSWLE